MRKQEHLMVLTHGVPNDPGIENHLWSCKPLWTTEEPRNFIEFISLNSWTGGLHGRWSADFFAVGQLFWALLTNKNIRRIELTTSNANYLGVTFVREDVGGEDPESPSKTSILPDSNFAWGTGDLTLNLPHEPNSRVKMHPIICLRNLEPNSCSNNGHQAPACSLGAAFPLCQGAPDPKPSLKCFTRVQQSNFPFLGVQYPGKESWADKWAVCCSYEYEWMRFYFVRSYVKEEKGSHTQHGLKSATAVTHGVANTRMQGQTARRDARCIEQPLSSRKVRGATFNFTPTYEPACLWEFPHKSEGWHHPGELKLYMSSSTPKMFPLNLMWLKSKLSGEALEHLDQVTSTNLSEHKFRMVNCSSIECVEIRWNNLVDLSFN